MLIRKSGLTVAAIVLLVAGIAACGSSGGSSGSGSRPAALDGTDWVLTAMTPAVPGLGRVTVTAGFGRGRLSGHSGCNSYHTSFTQDGSSLTLGKDIVSTRIACPSLLIAVEQAYLSRLPKVASFARSGSTLTLEDAAGTKILTYRPAPSGTEALAGDWKVTALSTGNAIESPTGDQPLSATFTVDGIQGNGGCNTFRGPVEVDGTSVTIGPIASTLLACGDPALGEQEQHYTAALEAAESFEVVGRRLSLFRADGTYAVILERA